MGQKTRKSLQCIVLVIAVVVAGTAIFGQPQSTEHTPNRERRAKYMDQIIQDLGQRPKEQVKNLLSWARPDNATIQATFKLGKQRYTFFRAKEGNVQITIQGGGKPQEEITLALSGKVRYAKIVVPKKSNQRLYMPEADPPVGKEHASFWEGRASDVIANTLLFGLECRGNQCHVKKLTGGVIIHID
jgi:hypothetical protein